MRKIIMFMVLMLVMSMGVNALTYHTSSSDFVDSSDGTACSVQTEFDCSTWRDWLILDYRDDSSLFKRLANEGITSKSLTGVYKFYIEYKLFDGVGYGDGNSDVNASCFIDYYNGTTNFIFSYSGDNTSTIEQDYLEVRLKDGEQLQCTFDTIYTDNSVANSRNRWYFRYWIPTYETESGEPDRRTIIKLESEVAQLEDKITGEYQSTQDYILEVLKAVVKINFKLWVYMYWLLLVALIVSVFSLMIYILWWLYNRVKGIR